jgi:hypothetical protein
MTAAPRREPDPHAQPALAPTPTPVPELPVEPPPAAGRRRRRRGRPFQIGRVLGQSFTIWFGNLPPFTLLSAIVFLPYVALQVWANVVDPAVVESLAWQALDLIVVQTLTFTVTAAVIYVVFLRLRGDKPRLGPSIAAGLSRLPAVLLVVLLMWLCIVGAVLPLGIASVAGGTPGAVIAVLIGVPLVLVLVCGFYVAVAACVVERPGIRGALARSWQLTRGSKFEIFVVSIVLGLFQWVVGGVVDGLVGAVLGEEWAWVVALLVAIVLVSISAVATAVVYHDLRVAKEGIDTAQLASVFD